MEETLAQLIVQKILEPELNALAAAILNGDALEAPTHAFLEKSVLLEARAAEVERIADEWIAKREAK